MGAYAKYLDARIRAWKDLKQDPVRVQTESNRRSDGLGAGCEWRCDSCTRGRAYAQQRHGG